MTHLIDKDALVAKIKKLEKMYCYDNRTNSGLVAISVFENINNVIDTLEVKEVDLEKELNTWRHNHFHGRRDIFANGEYLERVSQLDIAKHFFELGLKTKQTTI